MIQTNGRKRAVITNVVPQVEKGRYPSKAVIGEPCPIMADIFCDGHDMISASVLIKHESDRSFAEHPLQLINNDRWVYNFRPGVLGNYSFQILAWIDHFQTWKHGLFKKIEAHQDVAVEMQIGADIITKAAGGQKGRQKDLLTTAAANCTSETDIDALRTLLEDPVLNELMRKCREKALVTTYPETFKITVERRKAAFSTWYELFPRSASAEPGVHGNFKDVKRLLPRIAAMGFDTLYLPPIHPIGNTHRKGKNNSLTAAEADPGSPWAIGSELGGHKDIHPQLGNLRDFKALVAAASKLDIEVALDIAFQCSPDHPWVKKHPQWFKWRPDGKVQYAENPPKKYEDILPLDFETEDWQNLWQKLKSVFTYWIGQGVNVFRVDNPHTKSFAFWEWAIGEIRAEHPQVIFLAEAFTRPRLMERLAKVGFNQSYTYFTWRNTKKELETYVKELTSPELRYYFRPNFWPNTPDILPPHLTHGGENAHISRVILAATLSSNYGLYGPVYEFGVTTPMPGKEEYLDNEKYEIRHWNWEQETRISAVITLVNQIRHEEVCLQSTWNTVFLETSNDQLIGYAKIDLDSNSCLLIFVNIDAHQTQSAHVNIPADSLGLPVTDNFTVEDLLSGDRYQWVDGWNFVQLDPHKMPAHILKVSITQSSR